MSDCDPGFYCPGGNDVPNPVATPCPIGLHCPAGSNSPVPCAPGTFTNLTQQDTCLTCPAGFYCVPEEVIAGNDNFRFTFSLDSLLYHWYVEMKCLIWHVMYSVYVYSLQVTPVLDTFCVPEVSIAPRVPEETSPPVLPVRTATNWVWPMPASVCSVQGGDTVISPIWQHQQETAARAITAQRESIHPPLLGTTQGLEEFVLRGTSAPEPQCCPRVALLEHIRSGIMQFFEGYHKVGNILIL